MSSAIVRRSIITTSRPCLVGANRLFNTSTQSPAWIFSKEKEKTAAHSTLISNHQAVYEIVTESVMPSKWEDYLKQKEISVQLYTSQPEVKAKLEGSFSVVTGDQNFKAFHIFSYSNGYEDIDATRDFLRANPDHKQLTRNTLPMITHQETELTKSFSFWPDPSARSGSHIYDIRSYQVKPGSMYDWSNYWARGIKCRTKVRKDAAYAGLFTHMGQLHNIYHIWCYNSLSDRKQCREDTWYHEEWNEVVAATVPLVRTMSSRILEPLPFSPTQ